MKEWEKELHIYCLTPAPPKENDLQKYISNYLAQKEDKYISWFLHYYEHTLNEKAMAIVQDYAMYGHFLDIKQAYVIGMLNALQEWAGNTRASCRSTHKHWKKACWFRSGSLRRLPNPSGGHSVLVRKMGSLAHSKPSVMPALETWSWQTCKTRAGDSKEGLSSPATETLSSCRQALGICVAS